MIGEVDPVIGEATAAGPVVAFRGVAHTYPGPPPVAALKPADLDIWPGEHVAVIGPSGSGKSTFLNMVGLLDRPTAGTYHLDGVDVGELAERERTAIRGSRIGFVFQSFHLMQHRSATENVMISMLYRKIDRAERLARATQMLIRVGLEHRLAATPSQLSGGERQRVAIARALAGRPSLLLCDEPTGNLDTATADAVLQLLRDLNSDGLTILTVTHNMEIARNSARVVTIRDGVLYDGLQEPLA